MVYLDNNANAPVLAPVLAAMLPALQGELGNASSIHRTGQAAKAALAQARSDLAELINADASEIVFTSGGTESDNLAIFGAVAEWMATHPGAPPPHLLTTRIEHHAVLNAFEELEQRGYPVTYVAPGAGGRVEAGDIVAALRPDTALVSVMMANNETGVVQPICDIAKRLRPARIRFHVDAIQALGKISVNVLELGCDLLSLSGHKIHAASGVGALYIRRGVRIRPMLFGGRHERERRAGSENVAGIVGFGAAARLDLADPGHRERLRLGGLRDRLEAGLLEAIPHCAVVGAGQPRVPNTSNMRFDGIEAEALVIALDLRGFCISAGAACTSGAIEPSHVLLAMGYPKAQARSCVRFSLGRQNTAADIEALLATLPDVVARLRRLSPAFPPMARTA